MALNILHSKSDDRVLRFHTPPFFKKSVVDYGPRTTSGRRFRRHFSLQNCSESYF